MKLIHLNTGGRHFKLTIGAKPFYFEDHPHLGPMMTDRHGEPKNEQLDENHLFFEHYNAWREQGKRFERMGAVNYCRYKTRIQRLRATQAAKQPDNQ